MFSAAKWMIRFGLMKFHANVQLHAVADQMEVVEATIASSNSRAWSEAWVEKIVDYGQKIELFSLLKLEKFSTLKNVEI